MGCCGSKQFHGRKVVIIGGGYAGTTLAKKLDSSFDVVLVERKEVMVHVLAQVRAVVVGGEFASRTLISYDTLLKRGSVKRANVTSIRPDAVELEGGETIAIGKDDFLVIATGSSTPAPSRWLGLTAAAITTEQAVVVAAIRDAAKIVIVGGGPVGVELAGEIRDAYTDKDITIVHRGPYLCSGKNGGNNGQVVPASFGEQVADICRDKGITLRFGDAVARIAEGDPSTGVVVSPGDVTLVSGEVLGGVDLAVFATGVTVNNEAFRTTMAAYLNADGRLAVERSMLVSGAGCGNVFALGDCAEAGGSKTAYHAMKQAQIVAANVIARASGASEASLRRYDAGTAAMLLAVGRERGRAYLPPCGGITLGDGMVASIKGKDLFLEQTRRDLGVFPGADGPASASGAATE